MIVRNTFPKVYKLTDSKTGKPYWQVDARSKKYGMNERPTFGSEKEALDRARAIAEQVAKFGAQPEVPREIKVQADAYGKLVGRLTPLGKTPEDAVTHYITFLGEDTLRKAKPPISELADQWRDFKLTNTTLSKKTVTEIRSYARFIKSRWGSLKPDEPKRNAIELLLRKMSVANNTRRKYLRYLRMFFGWMKDEHLIAADPTDGIFFKPDAFNADFYDVPTTKKLLRYVVEHEKDLIGYYALLTFAGLRPSEGARVQWEDYTFKTNELYVRKGKTHTRYIILEPVAIEWMKFHRENTPHDRPFINLRSLENREKDVREKVLDGNWVQDGLRHGFGTYYKSKIKDIERVADYMGNSVGMVKRHYARAIPADECAQFWALTPAVALADELPKITE